MKRYKVSLRPAAQRDLDKLSNRLTDRVLLTIERLAQEPRPRGAKKLVGSEGFWRVRIGSYRVLYGIEEKPAVVTVFRIRHRREAYR